MSLSINGNLTVYFDCPFWVAVFERELDDSFQVCRIVIGTNEPKDYEVYDMVLKHYYKLNFSAPIESQSYQKPKAKNPKRLQRDIKKSVLKNGLSTKSQEAIRISREQHKVECKKQARSDKLLESKERYLFKQQQKKEKKRGH